MMNNSMTIKALKYPNIPHYEWKGELLDKTDEYVIIKCNPGREIIHHSKGQVFTINHTTIEMFSLKEWYTVAMDIEENKIISYYCNIAKPSILKDNELSFVDLDLDVVKMKDQDWEVVDQDEFIENSVKYQYPQELKEKAIQALKQLQDKINNKEFPFNESFKKEYLNDLTKT